MCHASFSRQWLRRTQVLVAAKHNNGGALETNLGSKNVNYDSQLNQAEDVFSGQQDWHTRLQLERAVAAGAIAATYS